MPAPTPLNIGPPPIRTKFDSQKDDPQGSGIAWPWLKFIQSIWTAITTLSFQNISGQINISQINATGTPSASTFLRGDASWSSASGVGVVTGMQGDGVVYDPVVPVVGGILEPNLEVQPAGTFLASPPTVSGAWVARRIFPSDLPMPLNGVQAQIDFGAVPNTLAQIMIPSPWVTATSKIVCSVVTGTPDHPANTEDAVLEDLLASAWGIVPGTSFNVSAISPNGSLGRYLVNCVSLG